MLRLMTTTSEADGLLRSAREGNSSAFASLIAPHLRPALGAATAITGSREEGEDVVQDAMVSAWVQIGKLREASSFGAWFRRIVVRGAIRATRRRRRTVWLEPTPAVASGPETGLDRLALDVAFDQLSRQDRAVIYLRFVLDLPLEATAEALAVPLGTVKSRCRYGLQRLRSAYEESHDA